MDNVQKAKLLKLLPKMIKINAHECAEAFRKAYGEKIDWHEFGYYLDELHTKQILKITSPGGLIGYALNKGE
jgi:hypothetical protein